MIHTDEDDEFDRIKRENAMREVQRLGQDIQPDFDVWPFPNSLLSTEPLDKLPFNPDNEEDAPI
jgi:hypothetical protein